MKVIRVYYDNGFYDGGEETLLLCTNETLPLVLGRAALFHEAWVANCYEYSLLCKDEEPNHRYPQRWYKVRWWPTQDPRDWKFVEHEVVAFWGKE